MVSPGDLAALERIARLRAEQELKKLAAFRPHIDAAEQQARAARAAMAQSYAARAPLSVAEARMANAQAGRAARDLARAQREIDRLQPRFEALRQRAAREFGRAEVLARLSRQSAKALRQRDEDQGS